MPGKQKANEAENNQLNASPKKGIHKKKKGTHKAKQKLIKAKQKPVNKKHKHIFGNPSDLAFAERLHWQTSPSKKKATSKDNDHSRRELYLILNQSFKVDKGNKPVQDTDVKNMWEQIRASQENNQLLHNDQSLVALINEQKEIKEVKEDVPDTEIVDIPEAKKQGKKEEVLDNEIIGIQEDTKQDKANFIRLLNQIEKHYGTSYDQIPAHELRHLILLQGYDETYLDLLYDHFITPGKQKPPKKVNESKDDTLTQFVQLISAIEFNYKIPHEQMDPALLKQMIIKEGYDPHYLKYLAKPKKGNNKQKQSKKYQPQYTDDEVKAATAYPEDIGKFKKFAKSMHKNPSFQEQDLKTQLNDMYNTEQQYSPFRPRPAKTQEIKEVKEDTDVDIHNIEEIKDEAKVPNLDGKQLLNTFLASRLEEKKLIQMLIKENPPSTLYLHLAHMFQKYHKKKPVIDAIIKDKNMHLNAFYQLIFNHWNQPHHFIDLAKLAVHISNMNSEKISDLPLLKSLALKTNITAENLKLLAGADNVTSNINFLQLMVSLFPTDKAWQDAFFKDVLTDMLNGGGAVGIPGMGGDLVFAKVGEVNSTENTSSNKNKTLLDIDFMEKEGFQQKLLSPPNSMWEEEQLGFAHFCVSQFKNATFAQQFIDDENKTDLDDDDRQEVADNMKAYLDKGLEAMPKQLPIAKEVTRNDLYNCPICELHKLIRPLQENYGKDWTKLYFTQPNKRLICDLLVTMIDNTQNWFAFTFDKTLKVGDFLQKPVLGQALIKFMQSGAKTYIPAEPISFYPKGDKSAPKKAISFRIPQHFILFAKLCNKMAEVNLPDMKEEFFLIFWDNHQEVFNYSPQFLHKFVAYYNRIPNKYQRAQFINRKCMLAFKKLAENKANPSEYFDSPLKKYIHNFFVFDYETLEKLTKRFEEGNKEGKPLCLILHTNDDTQAFVQDKSLKAVIDHPNLFTLVLEGHPDLASYGQLIPQIAKKYGVNKKIDQIMLAGHGYRDRMHLTRNHEFTIGNESLDQLLDVIFDNMDKVGDSADTMQPNRRFLMNSCSTNQASLMDPIGDKLKRTVRLKNGDEYDTWDTRPYDQRLFNLPAKEHQALQKAWYKNNPRLQRYIEAYAKKKDSAVKHIIGANQTTQEDRLMNKKGQLILADKYLDYDISLQKRPDQIRDALAKAYNPFIFKAYLLEAYSRDDFEKEWPLIKKIIRKRVANADNLKGQTTIVAKNKTIRMDLMDKELAKVLEEPFKVKNVYQIYEGWQNIKNDKDKRIFDPGPLHENYKGY
ncbi:MAG TPA: hypothetical protein DCS93_06605 [Microscillaceae bacterium]|nr:hypothetical protein [Microscillaceae bacterium]